MFIIEVQTWNCHWYCHLENASADETTAVIHHQLCAIYGLASMPECSFRLWVSRFHDEKWTNIYVEARSSRPNEMTNDEIMPQCCILLRVTIDLQQQTMKWHIQCCALLIGTINYDRWHSMCISKWTLHQHFSLVNSSHTSKGRFLQGLHALGTTAVDGWSL